MANIPNLNINAIGDGLQDRKNYEAILDILQRYRKELNFYLMNLDLDNMPVVAENIDGLHGRMETVDGRVSEFIQTVDGFRMTVSNYEGQVSEFLQTVDGFQLTVSNYEGQVSQFIQTVDGFQTTVANYQGQVSQFTQTVDGFQTQVSNYESEVGTFNSEINQLSDEVSSIVSFTDVSGNQIASKINQTATNISISASKIDLMGITKIYSPTTSHHATFDTSGDFYITQTGSGGGSARIFEVYNQYTAIDLRSFGSTFLSTGSSGTSYPRGTWDFYGATVTGLDIGGGNAIEAYYSGNLCYIDYGGSDRLTVRSMSGSVVGHITFD